MFFLKIQGKIQSRDQIRETIARWRSRGDQVVFTNGCFDLLHYGHVHYLAAAKDLGHRLVIGLNSDASVRRLKGPKRPVKDEKTRAIVLAALACVDAVVVFEEDTPLELIKVVRPNILVKGGDWEPRQIIGADVVLSDGGKVLSLPYIDGHSTTNILENYQR